ncbi:MAG: phage major capsid protein [Chloroflexota bacterium]|nr:phage major capsid protein [Chloroflexota bacterium]
MSETLVAFGGATKALADGKLGGYLVVYSDAQAPDLEGDFFTDATDFDVEDGRQVGVYYLHGQDATLGKRRIGKALLKRDPVGIWIEAQLDLRDDYERALYQLAQQGALGWSSGAAAHLVERTPRPPHHVTRWTIAEASLTPTPAEPRARVVTVKSLQGTASSAECRKNSAKCSVQSATSDAQEAKAAAPQHITSQPVTASACCTLHPVPTHNTFSLSNGDSMDTTPTLESLNEQLNRVLRYIEDAPAIKSTGYFTVDGGAADLQVKSLGDWLLAVMRGDDQRLRTVYRSTKSLNSDSGGAGGYTVPTEYSAQLLQVAVEQSQVLARVRRIPVNAPMGEYPALDQYLAPTAGSGNTAQAGGLKATKRAEGGSYTETEPQFQMIRYRLSDAASGMVKVTKELRMDSVAGIEAFLQNVIGVSVASKLEYYILRGTGVGEPLGILNAPAKIDITPDTNNVFTYADAVEMVGRFKAVAGAPTWLYHPGLINDIAVFQIGTGGAAFVNSMSAGMPMSLLGYPLISSEHLPQPDNSGCAVLADLGSYLLFDKGGLYIEFSEHAAFTEGKDTWRFGMRCDGQPWMKSAITLADPQGTYTVSPFVSFND